MGARNENSIRQKRREITRRIETSDLKGEEYEKERGKEEALRWVLGKKRSL